MGTNVGTKSKTMLLYFCLYREFTINNTRFLMNE